MDTNKTKVRYGVKYRDRNYEYALHSGKKHFLKNYADIVNVIEYCVTQDLKKNDFKRTLEMNEIEVIRFVNDKKDERWADSQKIIQSLLTIVTQVINDNIQRNN